jgi:3-oxoadipate enol-lactonase
MTTAEAPIRVGRSAVWTWGVGEPVVLLHPLALSGEVWRPFAGELAGHAVYAPDLRGHGGTGWDGAPFTVDDLAGDVVAILDGLGLASAHLVGLSLGGSVAVTLAGRFPGRVRSLVLADTTAWYGEDAPATWAQRAERALSVPRAEQVPFQVDRWFTEPFRAARPDEVDRVAGIFTVTDSAAHAAASTALGALDARPLLPSVTAPALVLVGEEDYATPPDMARELATRIPGARLRVLSGLRHLSLVERPALAADVAAHLAGAR